MKKRYKWLLMATAAAVLFTAGCSSKSSSANNTSNDTMLVSETAAAAEAMAAAPYQEKDISGSENVSPETADTALGMSSSPTPSAGRKLIRIVSMQVETENFDKMLDSIQASITSLGGYVEESHISGPSISYYDETASRYATIVARIPSTVLDSFVNVVEDGTNVISKSENTSDVTLDYSDTESRKKSLAVEQDRLWALLEKADSLDSIIMLEQRLSDIRYELESLESKLRLYDNQVDYSTVNLNIDEVREYTPAASESSWQQIQRGFTQNAHGVWEVLTGIFIHLITALPIWLPLVLVILFISFLVRRNLKKTKEKEISEYLPEFKHPADDREKKSESEQS